MNYYSGKLKLYEIVNALMNCFLFLELDPLLTSEQGFISCEILYNTVLICYFACYLLLKLLEDKD